MRWLLETWVTLKRDEVYVLCGVKDFKFPQWWDVFPPISVIRSLKPSTNNRKSWQSLFGCAKYGDRVPEVKEDIWFACFQGFWRKNKCCTSGFQSCVCGYDSTCCYVLAALICWFFSSCSSCLFHEYLIGEELEIHPLRPQIGVKVVENALSPVSVAVLVSSCHILSNLQFSVVCLEHLLNWMFLSSHRHGWILLKKSKNRFTVSRWICPVGVCGLVLFPKWVWLQCMIWGAQGWVRVPLHISGRVQWCFRFRRKHHSSGKTEHGVCLSWAAPCCSCCHAMLKWEICSLLENGNMGASGSCLNLEAYWESLTTTEWTLRMLWGPDRSTGVINGSGAIRANTDALQSWVLRSACTELVQDEGSGKVK